jgi:hypothetical protein
MRAILHKGYRCKVYIGSHGEMYQLGRNQSRYKVAFLVYGMLFSVNHWIFQVL